MVRRRRGGLLTHTRDSFAASALRHLRDAAHLAADGEHRSLEQAWHLAGFGPECARKAALSDRGWDMVLGHDLGDAGDDVLDMVEQLDPGAKRYATRGVFGAHPPLQRWTPSSRYDADGTRSKDDVHKLLGAATAATVDVLAPLWADGLVRLGG